MRILLGLTVSLLSFVLAGNVFAQSPSFPSVVPTKLMTDLKYPDPIKIGQAQLDPSSPFYFLKTIREGIELKFSTTPRIKLIRYFEFSVRRLREVEALILKDKQQWIEPVLVSYRQDVDTLYDLVSEDTDIWVADRLGEQLNWLISRYDKLKDPRAQLAARASIEKLVKHNSRMLADPKIDQGQLIGKIALDQSLGCLFLIKEATDSALTQAERVLIGDDAGKCLEDINGPLSGQLKDTFFRQQQ